MDWSDVRIFLAVARSGSLSGAAQRLGMSQPTMGRRLRALEDSTGQRLFQRGREGFQLTDEGASVLLHAERMEEEALAIERQLAGRGAELQGLLRVSSSDWFGLHVLSPVVARFVALHPGVRVDLITDSRFRDLARREAELVFRIRPSESPDIVQRQFMHMTYALYGPVGMPPPTAGDGAGSRLITLDAAFEDLPDVHWLRNTFPGATFALGSNNRDVQARTCALGAGFAVLPTLLGDQFPGIERHDVHPSPPGRDVWFAYHQDLRGLARLRAFLDLVINCVGEGAGSTSSSP
ncbi:MULTISPECIES: LysR family transcriptional regulator [Variovorax]|jgi:DNA-binding transcriptional LysR family regulator|uniref:LysR family transcriptional regulator n=1 Tax=Variovorax ginsengisoli TaxID=363844 RepID=A0ABT8S1J9_9BURK|nr:MULTISPECIES: LysR family transcriptional regulator [Variovorax]MDM0079114.1 LysR family transcriptional regulator [Variovorax sp. J31P179]MDN8613530.1 LysR family transcriptional regulator [Variovorax ginsengisoli]MDO1532700.1 LysR family transcriptional regulator [Variovorax ginsengisoli]